MGEFFSVQHPLVVQHCWLLSPFHRLLEHFGDPWEFERAFCLGYLRPQNQGTEFPPPEVVLIPSLKFHRGVQEPVVWSP